MPATVSIAKAKEQNPNWQPGWTVTVEGADVSISSRYGAVTTAVVVDETGQPQFDRPEYRQARYGQTPVWGRGADGKVRLALIAQARPHSDAPGAENFGQPNAPVIFLTCPMGFTEQVKGKVEAAVKAAQREMEEEVGEAEVLSEWQHPYGLNCSPSFETTWGDICALQVDIASLVPASYDPHEPIAGHFWLTVKELLAVVAAGTFTLPNGEVAYAAFGGANAAIFAFLAAHPEILAEGLS